VKRKVLLMAFDGDYVTERPEFETAEEAWNWSGELGSKWWFYPFVFIVTGKTIVDAPPIWDFLIGKRIDTAAKLVKLHSEIPSMQNSDINTFMYSLRDKEV
jgi:hypothetical protein